MSKKVFILNRSTQLNKPLKVTKAIDYAVDMLLRDINKVFGNEHFDNTNGANTEISIVFSQHNLEPEQFMIDFEKKDNEKINMNIISGDDLGIIYGLIYISNKYLGVDPFWFWNDKEPEKKEYVEIPMEKYLSPIPKVRFRGWFVNDEVLLSGWKDKPSDESVWRPVFEALLRCNGNMVIPGTDINSKLNKQLASDMGLWITHHHAEPLGAEMFLRVYPDKEASYDKHSEYFEKLWIDAINSQKDLKVIWNLGFRGQGDRPFWEDDPNYKTSEARGKLISKIIRRQYEIVKEHVEEPAFCTNLYGEIMELYKDGYIKFPEGVIKIWADSGYGKMVSRRQDNNNPRVYSLPGKEDVGPHGVYYHVTFYDLQASNHLTALPNTAEFVNEELSNAFSLKADEYLIVNSGNIRPHTYMLDLVSQIWNEGSVNIKEHRLNFLKRFYTSENELVEKCLEKYFELPVQYGVHSDERAGEQFYHYPARIIISHWLKGKINETEEILYWATGDVSFDEQVKCYKEKCNVSLSKWKELKDECLKVYDLLNEKEKILFKDTLLLQVTIHLTGCLGAIKLCDSYEAFKEGNYALAYAYASSAMEEYKEALNDMKATEHDKWLDFYKNDCLTNIKLTVYCFDTLRRYLRVFGDSPYFYSWEKEYILSDGESKVMLLATTKNQLEDDELAEFLRKKFNV
jgi:hypothetical protein